jgi:Domain of unknown function (DUF1707)
MPSTRTRGYDLSVALVGDRERENAAACLQHHFVRGRISLEELGTRIELALHARTRSDLRVALRGLPAQWHRSNELLTAGAGVVHKCVRLLAFFARATAWAICSFALATPFVVTLLALGPSVIVATVFFALWGMMSFILWRPWFRSRRSPTRPARG